MDAAFHSFSWILQTHARWDRADCGRSSRRLPSCSEGNIDEERRGWSVAGGESRWREGHHRCLQQWGRTLRGNDPGIWEWRAVAESVRAWETLGRTPMEGASWRRRRRRRRTCDPRKSGLALCSRDSKGLQKNRQKQGQTGWTERGHSMENRSEDRHIRQTAVLCKLTLGEMPYSMGLPLEADSLLPLDE